MANDFWPRLRHDFGRQWQPVLKATSRRMASWIEVDTELPSANEVVEVWIRMSRAGAVTRLRGYRLAPRNGSGHSLWLNALTHQPFPEGWRVTRWRKMDPPAGAAWPPAPTFVTPKQA